MAHKLIDQTYRPYVNAPLCEFICDTDADVENLPKCCTGSKAVSVATGITFMVNASGYWVPLGGGIVGGSLEGDGQEFHQFAPTALTFRSTEPLEEFQEVKVNDETVDPENYDLEEGSTIVKFKPDYLKTLGNGNHKIAIVSKNNVVSGKFEVKVPEVNEHGFYYNQPYTNVNIGLIILREDGKCDFVSSDSGAMQWVYTINGNELALEFTEAGMQFTGTVEANTLHINEMDATFTLDGETIAVDENYVYCYIEELNGYDARPFNFTKASYDAIKTTINDLPVVKIGNGAFLGNASLVNIEVPTSVTIIGDCAFNTCTALESIELPDDVTIIGHEAFRSCTALTSIVIPEGVITIGHSAFSQCKSLMSVELPDGVTTIDSNTFSHCTSLNNIILPDGVTTIGNCAFDGCKSLTSIEIPASVETIDAVAFGYCFDLESITFKGTVAQWNAITFGTNWNTNVPATYVQCTDGTVAL